jgi:hypothetical protein
MAEEVKAREKRQEVYFGDRKSITLLMLVPREQVVMLRSGGLIQGPREILNLFEKDNLVAFTAEGLNSDEVKSRGQQFNVNGV